MNAEVSTTFDVPANKVWDALTKPEHVKQYMMGANVKSDYKVGSAITWSGEFKGKTYEDRGEILACEKGKKLAYTHESSMAPGDVHNVTIELSEKNGKTTLHLTQDNNASDKARAESEKNWKMMLDGMKKVLS